MSETISVTQLNNYINALIEFDSNLSAVSVTGELSNVKLHSSGHMYFTLKDDMARINGVIFRNQCYGLDFTPKDGQKVIVSGRISVYAKNGTYQIVANTIRRFGDGDLYEAYLKLVDKFKSKGYFDENNKKPIPAYPKKIALITSPTGAAVRDMISVISRRNPTVKLIVCPVLVQGDGAARQISEMIKYVNKYDIADLIITGRGGGSIEELWAFNEEIVAESIFDSDIPVISAVGHETDFTICDFVADLRAATPSVAGELAVSDLSEIEYAVQTCKVFLKRTLTEKTVSLRKRLDDIKYNILPARISKITDNSRLTLSYLSGNMIERFEGRLKNNRTVLDGYKKMLRASSVEATLNRGFWIAEKNGSVLSEDKMRKGDKVTFRSAHTYVQTTIDEIKGQKNE